MPRLKRRSGSICQRKKYHSKRHRSQSVSDNCDSIFSESTAEPHVDHDYLSQAAQPSDHDYSALSAQPPDQDYSSQTLDHCCSTGQITTDIILSTETVPVENVTADFLVSESLSVSAEESENPLIKLQENLASLVCSPYTLTYNQQQHAIEIVEFYQREGATPSVKLCVVIKSDFQVDIYVHRTLVPQSNEFWSTLPRQISSAEDVCNLLAKLETYGVCVGNPDEEFHEITPIGCGLSHSASQEISAFREGDFGAVQGNLLYNSTIRSAKCDFLVLGARCVNCSGLRRLLRERKYRRDEQKKREVTMSSTYKHSDMTREMLCKKLSMQKAHIKTLQTEVERLKREMNATIEKGIKLDDAQNHEMKDLMAVCQDDMEQEYPDPGCYQRLFWEQQKKYEKHGKHGMRWHPMMIKLCLYLRQKSSKAYEALRDSGFVQLPSMRTLYDYSHYIESRLGFQPDVAKMLKEECTKKDMYSAEHRSFVGVLFDEVKIKEDLVYDKHSGEIVGYVNLGEISNQLYELERVIQKKTPAVAKCILVIMVRGVTSDLKFPFAAFATVGITADFLYPIIWKAISILEVTLKLKVLFCTCDGASPNRRFFKLHATDGEPFTHKTVNPYDPTRHIYFISDVPHLIKTARNCFSNSYSHTKSRSLWKDGKDISWMHIVRLYEEHCEQNLYTPCPKLTRGHIDLTAFSRMKVSFAAQVFSATVANSLEMLYDESVEETVKFVRTMNKFFDCLNVRNPYEGRNKRNPDLNAYTNPEDERLHWLVNDFLEYFAQWKQTVDDRGEFSEAQKATMQLSHQTLTGLKMSALSITACVRFMLERGSQYILTSFFNQDPLEQHFGHYRHKVGSNNNPTVYEVKNILTQIRTVGAQALPSARGNCKRDENRRPRTLDHTPVPRRKPKK
nr:uncharacterized protein LOC117693074 [Crassostrea gigas]